MGLRARSETNTMIRSFIASGLVASSVGVGASTVVPGAMFDATPLTVGGIATVLLWWVLHRLSAQQTRQEKKTDRMIEQLGEVAQLLRDGAPCPVRREQIEAARRGDNPS